MLGDLPMGNLLKDCRQLKPMDLLKLGGHEHTGNADQMELARLVLPRGLFQELIHIVDGPEEAILRHFI